jgi:hypothetical protein
MDKQKYQVVLIWDGTGDTIDFIFDDIDKALEFVKFLLSKGYSAKITFVLDDE